MFELSNAVAIERYVRMRMLCTLSLLHFQKIAFFISNMTSYIELRTLCLLC